MDGGSGGVTGVANVSTHRIGRACACSQSAAYDWASAHPWTRAAVTAHAAIRLRTVGCLLNALNTRCCDSAFSRATGQRQQQRARFMPTRSASVLIYNGEYLDTTASAAICEDTCSEATARLLIRIACAAATTLSARLRIGCSSRLACADATTRAARLLHDCLIWSRCA